MIVTCEQCETQFQLDDAKIPESGARVRCSRCKHAFFIEPPGVEDDVAAEELARSAVGGEGDGEDWQFNEAPRLDPKLAETAPDLGDFADDPGPDLEESSPAGDSSLDSGLDSDLDSGVASGVGMDTVEDLDAASSAVDDLLGGAGDLEADAPEQEPVGQEPLDQEPHAPEAHGQEPLEVDPPGLADEASEDFGDLAGELAEGPSDDLGLGDPDDWNFLDTGSGPEAAPRTKTDPQGGAILGRIPLVKADAADLPTEAARVRPPRVTAEDDEESVGWIWVARIAASFGWIATLGLMAAGLYGALAPAAARPEPRVGSIDVAGMRAEQVVGHWVENAGAGELFVVTGELYNPGSEHAAPGALLRVAFVDENGVAVAAGAGALGPPLDEADLRERNPRDLREQQELAARGLAWTAIAPGGTRELQAVFASVPAQATRFRIEADATVALPPQDPFEQMEAELSGLEGDPGAGAAAAGP